MERDDRDDWLAEDPPTWAWPWPCHDWGHIFVIGERDCAQCGLPYDVY